MSESLTIRDVPDEVREVLASRAAARGESLQEYLLAGLTGMTEKLTPEQWVDLVRQRRQAGGAPLTAAEIVEAIHADRDERADRLADLTNLDDA